MGHTVRQIATLAGQPAKTEMGPCIVRIILEDMAEMLLCILGKSLLQAHFRKAQFWSIRHVATQGDRSLQMANGCRGVIQLLAESLQVGPAGIPRVELLGLGETDVRFQFIAVSTQELS